MFLFQQDLRTRCPSCVERGREGRAQIQPSNGNCRRLFQNFYSVTFARLQTVGQGRLGHGGYVVVDKANTMNGTGLSLVWPLGMLSLEVVLSVEV